MATAERRMRPPANPGVGLRFALVLFATALALAPLVSAILPAFLVGRGAGLSLGFDNLLAVFQYSPALTWLGNSLAVAFSTVVVTILVAAPAGYVVARARGRMVSVYSLIIFALQSTPVILFLIPLFVLFARLALVDNLIGVAIIYIGVSVSAGIWMMSAAVASIPVSLEEAAWMDGCSVLGGFFRVIVPSVLPAILATAIFTFLTAWNDYLIAVVFLRSDANLTLGVGLQMARSPALIVIIILPPVLIFGLLGRYFSFGGVAGSLAGR